MMLQRLLLVVALLSLASSSSSSSSPSPSSSEWIECVPDSEFTTVKVRGAHGWMLRDYWLNDIKYNVELVSGVNITSTTAMFVDLLPEQAYSQADVVQMNELLGRGGRLVLFGCDLRCGPEQRENTNQHVSSVVAALGGGVEFRMLDRGELVYPTLSRLAKGLEVGAHTSWLRVKEAITDPILITGNHKIVFADQRVSNGRITIMTRGPPSTLFDWSYRLLHAVQTPQHRILLENLADDAAERLRLVRDGENPTHPHHTLPHFATPPPLPPSACLAPASTTTATTTASEREHYPASGGDVSSGRSTCSGSSSTTKPSVPHSHSSSSPSTTAQTAAGEEKEGERGEGWVDRLQGNYTEPGFGQPIPHPGPTIKIRVRPRCALSKVSSLLKSADQGLFSFSLQYDIAPLDDDNLTSVAMLVDCVPASFPPTTLQAYHTFLQTGGRLVLVAETSSVYVAELASESLREATVALGGGVQVLSQTPAHDLFEGAERASQDADVTGGLKAGKRSLRWASHLRVAAANTQALLVSVPTSTATSASVGTTTDNEPTPNILIADQQVGKGRLTVWCGDLTEQPELVVNLAHQAAQFQRMVKDGKHPNRDAPVYTAPFLTDVGWLFVVLGGCFASFIGLCVLCDEAMERARQVKLEADLLAAQATRQALVQRRLQQQQPQHAQPQLALGEQKADESDLPLPLTQLALGSQPPVQQHGDDEQQQQQQQQQTQQQQEQQQSLLSEKMETGSVQPQQPDESQVEPVQTPVQPQQPDEDQVKRVQTPSTLVSSGTATQGTAVDDWEDVPTAPTPTPTEA